MNAATFRHEANSAELMAAMSIGQASWHLDHEILCFYQHLVCDRISDSKYKGVIFTCMNHWKVHLVPTIPFRDRICVNNLRVYSKRAI